MAPEIASTARNWFDQGGKQYAQFRPEYPPALAAFLAAASNNRRLAIDVGCGSGQLTHQLANHFERVLGIDPSRDQLAHVAKHTATQKYIDYVCASAEALPIANRQASLVVAAQAAHWFDLPRFYEEVRRVGMQDAIVALVSYGAMVLDENLNTRFDDFYWNEIGCYWPPERKLVDSGYADLPFPFEELNAPPVAIQKTWTLAELLGYIGTWSAVKRLRDAGQTRILQTFAADLAALWGDPDSRRDVHWPINMRIGRLNGQ